MKSTIMVSLREVSSLFRAINIVKTLFTIWLMKDCYFNCRCLEILYLFWGGELFYYIVTCDTLPNHSWSPYRWIICLILEGEDICIVERLFSSSLVAVISLSSPRKLKICHFKVRSHRMQVGKVWNVCQHLTQLHVCISFTHRQGPLAQSFSATSTLMCKSSKLVMKKYALLWFCKTIFNIEWDLCKTWMSSRANMYNYCCLLHKIYTKLKCCLCTFKKLQFGFHLC